MRSLLLVLLAATAACGDDDDDTSPGVDGGGGDGDGDADTDADGDADLGPTCTPRTPVGDVRAPVLVRTLAADTGWFGSPVIRDLDGDGASELVTATYAIRVFDAGGNLLAEARDGPDRVYAPPVVADLEGDGVTDIVAGNAQLVLAYEWRGGTLTLKPGWPTDTTTVRPTSSIRSSRRSP